LIETTTKGSEVRRLNKEDYVSMMRVVFAQNSQLLDFVEEHENETDSQKLRNVLGCIYKQSLMLQNELTYYVEEVD
jgi:hypothetical protein